MRNRSGFVLLIVVPFLFAHVSRTQNLLVSPECVVFDSLHNRYLVTNYANGNVIQMDTTGGQTLFKSGYAHALGNCIIGNTFYFSTVTSVVGLDLATAATVMNLPISGAQQLDGMTGDDSGNLYVLEAVGRQMYKIRPSTQSYSVFVSSGLSALAQDVIFDKRRNRLLVCSWYNNSPIQAVSLADSSVSTVVVPTMGNFDGFAQDNEGNFYLSSWTTNCVHKFDSAFADPPVIVSSGHNGPSNLCFNNRDNILAVPNFNANRVDFIHLASTGVVDEDPGVSRNFALLQNYPNPFNPITTIRFRISQRANARLEVSDVLGRLVKSLVDEPKEPGTYSAIWDGTDNSGKEVSSGLYLYQLITDRHRQMRKAVLLK